MVADYSIERSSDELPQHELGSLFNTKLFYIDMQQDDISLDSIARNDDEDGPSYLKKLRPYDIRPPKTPKRPQNV